MSTEIVTGALIHDLAIVLRGSLHPSAEIGPAPRLAARRIQDVFGLVGGETSMVMERHLRAALAAVCGCCADNECECEGASLRPATINR